MWNAAGPWGEGPAGAHPTPGKGSRADSEEEQEASDVHTRCSVCRLVRFCRLNISNALRIG